MSLHMQQIRTHIAPGHAVCIALIIVSGERFVVVGVDALSDDEDIREVARAAVRSNTVIVCGGNA